MNNIPEVSQYCVEEPELVELVLAELTSFERSCLLLLIDEGFSAKEIAEILSKSHENVEIALSRAHEQFRKAHRQLHGRLASRNRYEKRPPDQQDEDDFIRACIKVLPGPEQSIALPISVRLQWEAQDCIDTVQDPVAPPTSLSALPVARQLPQDGTSSSHNKERQSLQRQSIIAAVRAKSEEEDYLQQIDPYISELVRQKMRIPFISSDIIDLEVDEIIQRVRIKLWQALQRKKINNPKAYIRCIIHTEVISFMRQKKHYLQQIRAADEELWEDSSFLSSCEGMRDPEIEVEQQETQVELLNKIGIAVQALPPMQRIAFICFLRERVDDPDVLNKAFQKGENTTVLNCRWPEERKEKQMLLISCNFARFRVAQSLGIDLNSYKRKR